MKILNANVFRKKYCILQLLQTHLISLIKMEMAASVKRNLDHYYEQSAKILHKGKLTFSSKVVTKIVCIIQYTYIFISFFDLFNVCLITWYGVSLKR